MSRGVNKVMLLGHLGGDPEVRSTPSGIQIASFSVATSERWKDKQTGEAKERTEWHRCEVWGRLAEVAAEYLGKGSQVFVEGSLRTEKWTDKAGIDRYTTKIRVDSLQMLGGGDKSGTRHAKKDDHAARAAGDNTGDEDDIPFD